MKAIDLGLSVMWGDSNLLARSPEFSGEQYTWYEATKKVNGLDKAGQILGRGWRLPTYQEVEELLSNPFRLIYHSKGIGIVVTGRNGNEILLPATTGSLESPHPTDGQYWTSTDNNAIGKGDQFRFDRTGVYGGNNKKEFRQAIRPVYDLSLKHL